MLRYLLVLLISFLVVCSAAGQEGSSNYPIEPVSPEDVHFTDSFWAERSETNREVTLPHVLTELEETGRIDNLRRAAANEDEYATSYPFDETDIYKAIEGSSHILQSEYDPLL
jgi:DUF1680 family protein